jgi:hypothetical protein
MTQEMYRKATPSMIISEVSSPLQSLKIPKYGATFEMHERQLQDSKSIGTECCCKRSPSQGGRDEKGVHGSCGDSFCLGDPSLGFG